MIITNTMSDTIQILLTQDEYDALKETKIKAAQVEEQLKELKEKLLCSDKIIRNKLTEIFVKQAQIAYLVGLFEHIHKDFKVDNISYGQIMQSICQDITQDKFQPEQNLDLYAMRREIQDKYLPQSELVTNLGNKLQSQDYLLKELQNNNYEKENRISNTLNNVLSELSDKLGISFTSVDLLEKHVQCVRKQLEETKAQNSHNASENRVLLDRFKEIKAEKERIEKVLQHYNNKIASLEEKLKVYERVQEQQKADEGKRKERLGKDRLYEIKLQIDEYIREIEQSLLKVGGLSEDERKHLGRMELTSLVDYIERAAK